MATAMTLARSTSRGSDFELAYASPTLLRAKGADQESLHRHNSKKHRPRAFSDEAGRMGRDGRNRRSRGSSDDEGQVTPDGFSNEDLRVGGPYLCSIPADAITVPGSHPRAGLLEHKTANGKALSQRIFDILRENQIELASISSFGRSQDLNLMLRRSQFNPEPQPTVTIVTFATRRMVDDTWLKAARQIYSLLCNEHIAQVSVEIIDPQAMRPPSTSPILRRDPIFNKWDPVLGEILQEVDLTDICAIGCYRRGRSSDISENPPTVLILVDISSSKSWKSTRDLVVRILARSDLHMVAVEIMKDRICKMANLRKVEGFESDLMRGRAIVGSPIANELNDEGSGSLGGFIQLQGPTSEWFTFLLTCFHVVDPPDKKILAEDRPTVDEWRQSGVPFSLRASKTPAERDLRDRNLTISQPSKLAASEKIASHQKTIDFYKTNPTYELGLTMSQEGILSELSEARRQVWNKISDAVNQEETTIDNIRRFVQRGADSAAPSALGFVNAASGYQRKVLHDTSGGNLTTMLDWALVRVDDKKDGDSSLHFSNRLDDKIVLSETASADTLSYLDSGPDNFRRLEFFGYRPGRNEVKYSGLKMAKVDRETVNGVETTVETLESNFVGWEINGHATMRGDSGSLMFLPPDPERGPQVVGMLIGGAEANDIGYFTRVDHLFEDIKTVTGAQDIRMYNK